MLAADLAFRAWRGLPGEPTIHSTISGGVIPYQGLIVAGF